LEWLVVISFLPSLFPLGWWRQLFDGFVEVAPSLVGLRNLFTVKLLVFSLGKLLGHFVGDFPAWVRMLRSLMVRKP